MSEGGALRASIEAEECARTIEIGLGPIEIGLGYAISTLLMCQGLLAVGRPDRRHVAIDPFQRARFADMGLQLSEDAGVRGLVEHRADPSARALPALLADESTSTSLLLMAGTTSTRETSSHDAGESRGTPLRVGSSRPAGVPASARLLTRRETSALEWLASRKSGSPARVSSVTARGAPGPYGGVTGCAPRPSRGPRTLLIDLVPDRRDVELRAEKRR
jgi:hypothetical protein